MNSDSHLNDVTNDEFSDLYLDGFAPADHVEGLLALDPVLEAPELTLLGPVVEGGHEHDDDDGDQDGETLDPRRMLVFWG